MKKSYGILAIALSLLIVAPALAQNPATVGVYFNTAGSQNTRVVEGGFNDEGDLNIYNAYVIAFHEGIMGGAAFKMELVNAPTPPFHVEGVSWASGSVAIGDLFEGVEFAWVTPRAGWFGTAIRICTLQFSVYGDPHTLPNAELRIVPFAPRYEDVMFSDADANLFPATGLTGYLQVPVKGESKSWSNVKSLYE